MIDLFIESKDDPYKALLSIKKLPGFTLDSNEETVSKRKGKRVKKELRTFTTQAIDNLFERFYHAKVAEERAARTLHQLYL